MFGEMAHQNKQNGQAANTVQGRDVNGCLERRCHYMKLRPRLKGEQQGLSLGSLRTFPQELRSAQGAF